MLLSQLLAKVFPRGKIRVLQLQTRHLFSSVTLTNAPPFMFGEISEFHNEE